MKKIFALLSFLLGAVTMEAAPKIDRIEPANWFAGMKNPSLQLMVYGKNIRNAHVTVDYPGARIDSLVRLDSPNYLLVYLNLEGARRDDVEVRWQKGEISAQKARDGRR